MGTTTQSIPFFSDEITLVPHTASSAGLIGRPITIRRFARGGRVSLEQVLETKEYIARDWKGNFIQGPEHWPKPRRRKL